MTKQQNEYRASPFLNYSGMKKILISPAHYQSWLNEQMNPEEPERELRIGLAVHALSMRPQDFDNEFTVAPVCDRRTNEGKRIWKEHLESTVGKMTLTAEEFEISRSCADSVRRNIWFKKAMEDKDVMIEKPLYLKNDTFKYGLKGTPDIVSPGNKLILDIKTHGGELTRDDIAKAITRNRYNLQELVYSILTNTNEIKTEDFIFIFVEKKEPYSSVSVGIDNRFMSKAAMDDLTEAVDRFNKSMDTGVWPDLSESSILV